MSLRALAARHAPDMLRWTRQRGLLPDPETAASSRWLGQRPAGAAYEERFLGPYLPPARLTAPDLRPAGPAGDAYAGRIDAIGAAYQTPRNRGVFEVPDVRIWPKFGVHAAPSGQFVEVYCGLEALRNPKYELPRQALPLLPPAQRHRGAAGSAIFLVPPWYHNYYHWMIDILPRLSLLGPELARGLPVLVPAQIGGFARATLGPALAAAGAPGAQVIELGSGIHAFERLVMPANLTQPLDVSPDQPAFLRRMAAEMAGTEPVPEKISGPDQGRRLYISRRDAAIRRIANEEEIAPLLAARGFETVVLTGMSPAEQARLFASASAVVAHHGAGLTNLAFCPPGGLAIEIFQEGHFSPSFSRLARVAGLRYGFGLGRPEGGDTWLDPAQLRDLLDRAGL